MASTDSNLRKNVWQAPDSRRYAYLLGCCLGDGHVTHKPPGTWTLRLACDPKYPGLNPAVRHAFPQHGPGPSTPTFRHFFSNLSADIRDIFRDHCRLLGVHVTQPNHRNLAIQHRDSVAILERIVGPKS